MLVPILIGIAVLIAALVAFIATRPTDFRIERSAAMSAPPSAPFAQVNDFHNWDGWSPWAKLDTTMKTIYEGPPAGTGSIYHWTGNNKVGEGRMTILESRPSELVGIKLEFMRPFAATHRADFTFKPEGDKTLVSWIMTGQNNFMAKAFHLMMNMDKMLGGEFDKGLAAMKGIVEGTGDQ